MQQQKPNFIVFLTDDQGYGDLSCMGATDFVTPHLDTGISSTATAPSMVTKPAPTLLLEPDK